MIDSLKFNNGLCGFKEGSKIEVVTVKEVSDEDWKTASVHGIKPIPPGVRLLVKEVVHNFYGRYLVVDYADWQYYLDPLNCDFVKEVN